jgi:hypothetical protein
VRIDDAGRRSRDVQQIRLEKVNLPWTLKKIAMGQAEPLERGRKFRCVSRGEVASGALPRGNQISISL